MFKLIKQSKKHHGRRGVLKTRQGNIQTPFFMPIATKAAVKSLSTLDLVKLKPEIILSNTYHLMIRPGEKLVKKAGGLHEFMKWPKSILTDSGGFQVFSLGKIRKIEEDGVTFNSHVDGKKFFVRPEDSIRIQLDLDSDIIMAFDECVALPAEKKYIEKSVAMTSRWARRCQDFFSSNMKKVKSNKRPLLFGIVQGGLEKDLRIKSAQDLTGIGFDGYAIGGLSVGESESEMYKCLDYITNELPQDRPRYLMGVGRPENIINAVKRGVDMFDCVIPTREARHGRLYLFTGKGDLWAKPKSIYKTINIRGEKFKDDFEPINKDSKIPELKMYSRAYLRHLFVTDEPLGIRLATLNNVEFYLKLMEKIRASI